MAGARAQQRGSREHERGGGEGGTGGRAEPVPPGRLRLGLLRPGPGRPVAARWLAGMLRLRIAPRMITVCAVLRSHMQMVGLTVTANSLANGFVIT